MAKLIGFLQLFDERTKIGDERIKSGDGHTKTVNDHIDIMGFFTVLIDEKMGIIDCIAIIFNSFRIICCHFGSFSCDSVFGDYNYMCGEHFFGIFRKNFREKNVANPPQKLLQLLKLLYLF